MNSYIAPPGWEMHIFTGAGLKHYSHELREAATSQLDRVIILRES